MYKCYCLWLIGNTEIDVVQKLWRSPAILVNSMMMLENLQCTSYFVFNLHEIGLSLERPSLAYHLYIIIVY